ncbi:MAG TPA: type II toxin-antitoxin system VapC family toxin, partial [Thermodesulfobacteriota bacterium]|nr:type II toxin-antitoxin system VapC family toxin [Thermodesulfobacteriota bacterium]
MTPLLRVLRNRSVALDTMIFIYAFEEHPAYLPILKSFFHVLEKGEMSAVTSALTITECLVQPYRKKDFVLSAQYLFLFRNFPNLSIIPLTDDIAERAAFLRAQHNLRTPDAIQLATALVSGCHAFLTNDDRLLVAEGIRILVLD